MDREPDEDRFERAQRKERERRMKKMKEEDERFHQEKGTQDGKNDGVVDSQPGHSGGMQISTVAQDPAPTS